MVCNLLQCAVLNKMLPKGFKLELNERTKHHLPQSTLPKSASFKLDDHLELRPALDDLISN